MSELLVGDRESYVGVGVSGGYETRRGGTEVTCIVKSVYRTVNRPNNVLGYEVYISRIEEVGYVLS